jgi:hypothetical protein
MRMTMIAAHCLICLIAGATASSKAAPPPQDRTASWYADHPSILAKVTELCRDDPGHAVRNPDCMNASQAQVLIALRNADHRNAGNLTPPSDPQYWQLHPGELPFQLAICDRLSPEDQRANWCRSAYAAAGRAGK